MAPISKAGAPAFGDSLSRMAQRKVTMWSSNKLPVFNDCHGYLRELKLLLKRKGLSVIDCRRIGELLYKFYTRQDEV